MRWLFVVAVIASCAPRNIEEPLPVVKPRLHAPEGPLPRTFEPRGYEIALSLGDSFTGTVKIEGDVDGSPPVIWLHSSGLDIEHARIGTTRVDVEKFPLRELIALEPSAPLQPGRVVIELTYRGSIESRPAYADAKSEHAVGIFEQSIGIAEYTFTQFFPTYARRAFPCIDEPDRKVPWQLTLDVPRAHVALSNTPVEHETIVGERKRVQFARTQPLSSYLVAFAVGPFDVVDAGRSKSGVPIRIFTERSRAADANEEARWTPRLFDLVEEFAGMPYAYGKLDFVAIPNTGPNWIAMENAGLVTFHRDLLHGEWNEVATHEIAHHWFGNLVTPKSFRDIWLSEAFAVWVTSKIMTKLGTEALGPVKEWGWYNHKLPARVRPAPELKTIEEMSPYFSGWYGVRVIDQFERYIGPSFVDAVRAYLKQHAHRAATTSQLAAHLGPDIERALVASLDKPLDLFPEVRAEVHCETPEIRLSRSHRREDYDVAPVCVAYEQAGARAEKCVMLGDSATIPLSACPKWATAAGRTGGFYRVGPMSPTTAMLDAWAVLTPHERQHLLTTVMRDDPVALRVAVQLLQAADAESVEVAADYLIGTQPLVPDALRSRFDAWVLQTIGARARAALADPKQVLSSRSMITLAAFAGDAQIRREAIRRSSQKLHRDLEFFVPIAIQADREIARRVLHGEIKVRFASAWLGRSPDVLRILAENAERVAKLEANERLEILQAGCNDKHLSALGAMQYREASLAIRRVQECVAQKTKLEPAFKAWLARVKPTP